MCKIQVEHLKWDKRNMLFENAFEENKNTIKQENLSI
jgi:hypothetical protein